MSGHNWWIDLQASICTNWFEFNGRKHSRKQFLSRYLEAEKVPEEGKNCRKTAWWCFLCPDARSSSVPHGETGCTPPPGSNRATWSSGDSWLERSLTLYRTQWALALSLLGHPLTRLASPSFHRNRSYEGHKWPLCCQTSVLTLLQYQHHQSFVFFSKSFHFTDIQLFWMNASQLKENESI